MSKSPHRALIVPLLITSLVLTGCTHTIEHKVARVSPANATGPTTRPAPETAVYKVKVRRESEDDYHSLPGTAAVLSRGETIGFDFDECGNAYAVAGRKTFPIQLPADWRRLTWHTGFEEPTELAIGMDEAMHVTADVAKAAALGAAAGFAVVESWKTDRKKRRHRH
jgi:hypothetical protein